MQPDQLTHTLTVRVSPALRDELAVAAENLDCSVGELTRRSLRLGLDDADRQTMSPRAPLPSEERVAIVSGSLKLPGNPDARQEYLCAIIEELASIQECGDQLMTAVAIDDEHQNLDAYAGHLRQIDLHIQRAAAGINGLRIARIFETMDAETRAPASTHLAGEAH